MRFSSLLRQREFAHPEPYDGSGEVQFAVLGCCLWFLAIVVRLSFSSKPWTFTEKLIEAVSFVVFAGIPIFGLATPQGERFARILLKRNGLLFQILICVCLGAYFCIGKILNLNPALFRWMTQLDNLILPNNFWLNIVLVLIGIFIVLRIPFLFLRFRDQQTSLKSFQDWKQNQELILLLICNFVYTSLVNTSIISPELKSETSGYYIGLSYFLLFFLMNLPFSKRGSPERLRWFDFFLAIACINSLFWFSRPFLSFGVFIGLTLFILILIYGTGLGRAHFGYSFQVRFRDLKYLVRLLAIATLILLPLTLLFRFAAPQFSWNANNGLSQISFFLSYAILFSFRVGVFEEILFRCGLMTMIRDCLQSWKNLSLNRTGLVLIPVVLCSIVFGFCHIGNTPRADSLLSAAEYKAAYVGLATIASMFYSLAFGETNRLWCSIMIHGIVDTIAVVVLRASLTVPF